MHVHNFSCGTGCSALVSLLIYTSTCMCTSPSYLSPTPYPLLTNNVHRQIQYGFYKFSVVHEGIYKDFQCILHTLRVLPGTEHVKTNGYVYTIST